MSSTGRDTGWSLARLRATLLGKPIPTSRAHHERLGPLLGLPVFSSDALSSVAYATEAILGILVLAGANDLSKQVPITLAICALIVIIAFSYHQTIHAYPSGGGSYIVASANLGQRLGLLAGAALLIDYVLTVSVSVAAGVAAIVSAFPQLHSQLVILSLASILFVAWLNLRGVRESGAAFAIPVYAFIVGILGMIVWGLLSHGFVPPHGQSVESDQLAKEPNVAMLFLVLRAFAAGCTALTGIEAVSNGVPAFKAPEAKNAALTLNMMAGLLVLMFVGIGWLSSYVPHLGLYSSNDPHYRSLVSQVAAYVFGGDKSIGFYFIQFATAIILILAANTSFADFPRLASLMARDGYLPRSLARQGDRLVFHNGILLLAVFAGALVWYFHGQLDLLLPLYAIGVFTAFTLSQAGMVVHWFKDREPGWQRSAVINGIGALLSGVVLVVILVTKFLEGAWIVTVLLAILYSVFLAIRGRYAAITRQLDLGKPEVHPPTHHQVLLLVPRVHKGIVQALEYALMIQGDVRAVHVTIDERNLPALRRNWDRISATVPLVVLNSPFRSLIDPLLDYIDELQAADPQLVVTVIVPEAITLRWPQRLLQENVAAQIKVAASKKPNVVVTNVRYFLDQPKRSA
jgi:amino acid transporter